MVSDKNRAKSSFQILNNDVEGDWSTVVFEFNYKDTNSFEVYVDNAEHARLFTVKFSFDPTNTHAAKYVDGSYRDVGNKLYRLFSNNDQLTFKQLEQALHQFEATAKYVNNL